MSTILLSNDSLPDTPPVATGTVQKLRPMAYIAGPMRGIPEFNFPAFEAAANTLRRNGFAVIDPTKLGGDEDFNPSGCKGDIAEYEAQGHSIRASMSEDLMWLCQYADLVVLLDGWENSLGAFAEAAVAKACGINVTTIHEFDEDTELAYA